jgi:RNA polymerase sigma factor for flagellar operon FliA
MEQLKKRVRAAMEQLPEKERKLLEGYYFRGKTLEEAGAEIGQSKSWASRLHARAIEELKRILAEDEVPSDKPGGRTPSFGSAGQSGPRRSINVGTTDERPADRTADRPAEAAGSGLPAIK